MKKLVFIIAVALIAMGGAWALQGPRTHARHVAAERTAKPMTAAASIDQQFAHAKANQFPMPLAAATVPTGAQAAAYYDDSGGDDNDPGYGPPSDDSNYGPPDGGPGFGPPPGRFGGRGGRNGGRGFGPPPDGSDFGPPDDGDDNGPPDGGPGFGPPPGGFGGPGGPSQDDGGDGTYSK